MKKQLSLLAALAAASLAAAADIALPAPTKTGGKPLQDALVARQSLRAFSDQELTAQQLSDLLWSANGVSRDNGKRTAPSARDKREIDIYALTKDGAYLYEPGAETSTLKQVNDADLRADSGLPGFSQAAPVTLIYVVNRAKQGMGAGEASVKLGAVDIGFIGQNVYLWCASENLATVFLGTLDAKKLAASLKLADGDEAFFAQPVGFPKE